MSRNPQYGAATPAERENRAPGVKPPSPPLPSLGMFPTGSKALERPRLVLEPMSGNGALGCLFCFPQRIFLCIYLIHSFSLHKGNKIFFSHVCSAPSLEELQPLRQEQEQPRRSWVRPLPTRLSTRCPPGPAPKATSSEDNLQGAQGTAFQPGMSRAVGFYTSAGFSRGCSGCWASTAVQGIAFPTLLRGSSSRKAKCWSRGRGRSATYCSIPTRLPRNRRREKLLVL